MRRPALFLLALLLPATAGAQSRGCIERPIGPSVEGTVVVPVPQAQQGRHTPRVAAPIPSQPSYGTECIAVAPPPQDILRGEPPPAGGLLRGDDGRSDLLRGPTPARTPAWR